MRWTRQSTLWVTTALVACAPSPERTPESGLVTVADDAHTSTPFVPYQALVRFDRSAAAVAVERGGHIRRIQPIRGEVGLVELEPESGRDATSATWAGIHALRARADVVSAQPNWTGQFARVPTDTLYAWQWQYPVMRLPEAWDLTEGSASIRIAILDTGATQHPDLALKWVPGLEYDALHQAGDARATGWSHAVHVASLAAGRTNETSEKKTGSAGVCWNCELLNVRVGLVVPDVAAVVRGIYWAVDHGANIVNLSLEINQPCSAVDEVRRAVEYATTRNVVVVAAAGNAGVDAGNTTPASCPEVVSVGATDRNGVLATYSNHTRVTVVAPGGNGLVAATPFYGEGIGCSADPSLVPGTSGVLAAWTTPDGRHCHRYLAGTSMSAGQVSGVIGLMLSRRPTLTPAQIIQILQQTAVRIRGCGLRCGAGMVDAAAAVAQAAPVPTGDAPPVARFTASCTGLSCRFDARGSTDDLGIVAYQWRFPGSQVGTSATPSFFMPGYVPSVVTLRVTDSTGHASEVSQTVVPSQPAVAPQIGSYDNPKRPGAGLDLAATTSGELVATWFTYEIVGPSPGRPEPVWYISGTGPRAGARWSQPLYRASRFGGQVTLAQVGTIGLDFSTSTSAWMSWTLGGRSGGERFERAFGGTGRSGIWSVPVAEGWGYAVQESSGFLGAAVTFYDGSEPRWAHGVSTASSNAQLSLNYFTSPGLCPYCAGREGPSISPAHFGTLNLQIAQGSSVSGSAAVNLQWQSPTGLVTLWSRPLEPIVRVTGP